MTASPVQPKLWTRYRHYSPALVILLVSLSALFLTWQDLNWRHRQRLQEYFAFETQRITGNISECMDLWANAALRRRIVCCQYRGYPRGLARFY
jgi:hypothetical protein